MPFSSARPVEATRRDMLTDRLGAGPHWPAPGLSANAGFFGHDASSFVPKPCFTCSQGVGAAGSQRIERLLGDMLDDTLDHADASGRFESYIAVPG